MALPAGFEPSIATARRYLFRAECEALRVGDDGPATAFHARRLDAPGTDLPDDLPGRALLLAAGVLAVEEVTGAGVAELATYGLPRPTAEALIAALTP